MTKRMLIDALHPEQTRVAVIDGNRIEDLDFESAARKQLKGNIYLAKVTRIEPSLQAAFVDYGGNRHGFLSFAEIHPDYYRLPISDREKLDALLADATTPRKDEGAMPQPGLPITSDETVPSDSAFALSPPEAFQQDGPAPAFSIKDWLGAPLSDDSGVSEEETGLTHLPLLNPQPAVKAPARIIDPVDVLADLLPDQPIFSSSVDFLPPILTGPSEEGQIAYEADLTSQVESIDGADDPGLDDEDGTAADENTLRRLRQRFMRHYKIQEVIKRRQVMLVQVVKEERGNKGAALTTYLSLPGRYCVLMPNSPRGGGVSRKVTNPGERKRLKEILDHLEIPHGMSVILRTAGIERTEAEIKRDFEYLMRLWDTIREMTLQSTAPALIYEEGNLIKRSIRDLYNNSISEIIVAGETGYQNARDFVQMLMPGHANRVVHYSSSAVPLFFKYQAEGQIETLDSPIVQLKSGGYLVINPTEALVSIDVNSGRSTRERDIEETALRTNIEAAEEIARQIRLRDLAGLVVIDFIDMEDGRNNATVERRIKEAMKNDRARLQIGRISAFGLLELSRQRLRPSLLETNFEKCPHCSGIGYIKTPDTAALSVLRAIEEEGLRNRASEITVYLPAAVALHILNHKRGALADIEQRHNFQVIMQGEEPKADSAAFRIEKTRARSAGIVGVNLAGSDPQLATPESGFAAQASDSEPDSEETSLSGAPTTDEPRDSLSRDNNDKRRRRNRRGGRNPQGSESRDRSNGRERTPVQAAQQQDSAAPVEATSDSTAIDPQQPQEARNGEENRLKRKRGRRGGRRRTRAPGAAGSENGDTAQPEPGSSPGSNQRSSRPNNFQPVPQRTNDNSNFLQSPSIHETAPNFTQNRPQQETTDRPQAHSGETVNQTPDKPRTGWWRRLTGV